MVGSMLMVSRVVSACIISLPGDDTTKNTSWGRNMARLHKGLELETPRGLQCFRGGTAILVADTPAAAELEGKKQAVGPSTKSICRACHCRQDLEGHKFPNSFLASQQGWKRCCAGRSTRYKLRSSEDLSSYICKLQDVRDGKISATALCEWMQEMGTNSFLSAMWRCPLYPAFTGSPQDIMHVFFEGLCKQVLGATAFMMIRHACQHTHHAVIHVLPVPPAMYYPTCDTCARLWGVDPDDLHLSIRKYAREHQKSRSDFPYVNSSRLNKLSEGKPGELPANDCDFPGTSIQVAHLMLAAPLIWGHLISPEHRKHLVWQVLLLESKIACLLWQRSFTSASLLELDRCIWLHDSAWTGCPELQHLWKPKNHYLSHVPLDILRWGPPRGYWCIPFEHENQFTKGAASHSNYANVLWSCAEAKALRIALDAMEGKPG